MKSKELIEKLKEIDPEGDIHVDIGAVNHIYLEAGYWDGYYSYLENDILHMSTSGSKIVVKTVELDSIIWDNYGDLEKIMKCVNLDNLHENKRTHIMEQINSECVKAKKFEEQSFKEFFFDIFNKLKSGYKIIEVDNGKYKDYKFIKDGKIEGTRLGDKRVIADEQYFKRVVKKDYVYMELII